MSRQHSTSLKEGPSDITSSAVPFSVTRFPCSNLACSNSKTKQWIKKTARFKEKEIPHDPYSIAKHKLPAFKGVKHLLPTCSTIMHVKNGSMSSESCEVQG